MILEFLGFKSWKRELLDEMRSLSGGLRSLRKDVEELLEKFEESEEENSSQIETLKSALESKTKFIENSFSNMLEKTINGHTANGHDKNEDLIDITKLSPTMQTMVRTKLKEANTGRKLP